MTDIGSFIDYAGRPAVRFERTYQHPAARVWAALTDPDQLGRWFPSSVDLDPRVGGQVRFSGDPYAEDSTGVVLVFDPPHRLGFSWLTDELHFTLEPLNEGRCRLTLVNVLSDRSEAARNAAGWQVCLTELAKTLEGQPSAGPHSDEAAGDWEPLYQAHLRAGLPAGADVPSEVRS